MELIRTGTYSIDRDPLMEELVNLRKAVEKASHPKRSSFG